MADPAVRVGVPAALAEIAGASLWSLLGSFQEIDAGETRYLVFYPFRHGAGFVEDDAIRAALPGAVRAEATIERVLVPGGWEESWKRHFRPVEIGRLRIRPPWEEPQEGGEHLDLVLNPGLAFGTGLHPTTRGVLRLLQDPVMPMSGGPLLDVGTGSGILAVAASVLGYDPVRAVDVDPQAVEAARANLAANGVDVEVRCLDAAEIPPEWFRGATVLANITLEPVAALLDGLSGTPHGGHPEVQRMLVAGILSGGQERSLAAHIERAGLRTVTRVYEQEWVSFDLRPSRGADEPASQV